jgi:hypothetical protein
LAYLILSICVKDDAISNAIYSVANKICPDGNHKLVFDILKSISNQSVMLKSISLEHLFNQCSFKKENLKPLLVVLRIGENSVKVESGS